MIAGDLTVHCHSKCVIGVVIDGDGQMNCLEPVNSFTYWRVQDFQNIHRCIQENTKSVRLGINTVVEEIAIVVRILSEACYHGEVPTGVSGISVGGHEHGALSTQGEWAAEEGHMWRVVVNRTVEHTEIAGSTLGVTSTVSRLATNWN